MAVLSRRAEGEQKCIGGVESRGVHIEESED